MKRLIVVVLGLILGHQMFGQELSIQDHFSDLIPVGNPDAAALGQYGQNPIGSFAGTTPISIPIHIVKSGNLSLNVNLSYHNGGIKVTDKASSVGLGWSLNAGGVINRMVKGGMPDSDGSFGYFHISKVENFSDMTQVSFESLKKRINGVFDQSADWYIYNFAGRSGRFTYDQNLQPHLLPYEPLVIERVDNGHFRITDSGGTVYDFASTSRATLPAPINPVGTSYNQVYHLTGITSHDEVDHISFHYTEQYDILTTKHPDSFYYRYCEQADISVPEEADCTKQFVYQPVNSTQEEVRYLSKITYATGEVEFIYVDDRLDSSDSGKRLAEIRVKSKNSSDGELTLQKTFVLNSSYFEGIDNPNGLLNDLTGKYRLRLDSIDEYDALLAEKRTHSFEYNTTPLPSRYSLSKDYWGYYNGQTKNHLIDQATFENAGIFLNVSEHADRETDPDLAKAGILTQINYPTGGHTKFSYEVHEYIYVDPTTFSEEVEHYQMASGAMSTLNEPSPIVFTMDDDKPAYMDVYIPAFDGKISQNDQIPYVVFEDITSGEQSTYYGDPFSDINITNEYRLLTANHTYQIYARAYDTDGDYTVTVEPYIRITYDESTENPPETKKAGGLRVTSIENYESSGQEPTTYTFEYEDARLISSLGFGVGKIKKRLKLYEETESMAAPCISNFAWTEVSLNGRVSDQLSSMAGSPVTYQKVIKYYGTPDSNIGKTELLYDYQTAVPIPISSYHNDGVIQDNWSTWKGGFLKNKREFKFQNDEYTLNKEELYTYGLVKSSSIDHFIMGWKEQPVGDCFEELSQSDPLYEYWLDLLVYGTSYSISSAAKVLLNKESISYEAGMNISTSQTYEYNVDLLKPVTVSTGASNSDLIVSRTKYLGEYDDSASDFISVMKDEHMLSYPVETQTWVNEELVTSQVFEYANAGSAQEPKIVPYRQYSVETDEPLSEVEVGEDLDSTAPYAVLFPNVALYELKSEVAFDEGRLVEFQRVDNLESCQVWGYNNSLRVVQATNVGYDILANALSATLSGMGYADMDELLDYVKSVDPIGMDEWEQFNTTLRNQSTLQGAQVTTYSYNPMNGMTSQTDPNGRTIYYEYDDFGRLKSVRDNEGDLISEHTYHYQSSND